MTTHGALHPDSDVDRLYLKRSEVGSGLISIQYCARGEDNGLGLYVRNSEEKPIEGVRMAGTIEPEGNISKSDFLRNKLLELKQKCLEKKMCGQINSRESR